MKKFYSSWAGFRLLSSFLTVFLCLAGCSPALNWRVVAQSDGGYSATYPDKPVSVTRQLMLAGLSVPLTLQAATVEGSYYAVGVVDLAAPAGPSGGASSALSGKGPELQAALIQALLNNVKSTNVQSDSKAWAGVSEVVWVQAEGTLPDGTRASAQGRFFQHQGKLYEVLLVGPANKVDAGTSTQFFSGFKLLGL